MFFNDNLLCFAICNIYICYYWGDAGELMMVFIFIFLFIKSQKLQPILNSNSRSFTLRDFFPIMDVKKVS